MTEGMYYETLAYAKGYTAVCGVDEAGRGPLAGPVVAAAVILPQNHTIEGLNDSKKLTEKKREVLFPVICKEALAFGIGFATVEEIDTVNILQATYLAMARAVAQLKMPADYALIDGNRMPLLPIAGETIVKGDSKSDSIAAASILAKVTRDRFMVEVATAYPQYQFERHKGYGTKLHRELLLKYGASPVHRVSFLKKILGAQK